MTAEEELDGLDAIELTVPADSSALGPGTVPEPVLALSREAP